MPEVLPEPIAEETIETRKTPSESITKKAVEFEDFGKPLDGETAEQSVETIKNSEESITERSP